MFITSFSKSQFPHKRVNLSFIITDMNNQLTDLCGNWLLQNDFENTLSEIRVPRAHHPGGQRGNTVFFFFALVQVLEGP